MRTKGHSPTLLAGRRSYAFLGALSAADVLPFWADACVHVCACLSDVYCV